jgi:hypothetical protein
MPQSKLQIKRYGNNFLQNKNFVKILQKLTKKQYVYREYRKDLEFFKNQNRKLSGWLNSHFTKIKIKNKILYLNVITKSHEIQRFKNFLLEIGSIPNIIIILNSKIKLCDYYKFYHSKSSKSR